MPLTVHCYERDEYGSFEEYPDDRDGRYALPFKDQILGLIKRCEMPEEVERGLMHWYHEQDVVNEKVLSVRPTVEAVGGELAGVMVCRVRVELTADELDCLNDWVSGQASDGYGEGLEQRKIKTDEGEIYVSFWNSGRVIAQRLGRHRSSIDREVSRNASSAAYSGEVAQVTYSARRKLSKPHGKRTGDAFDIRGDSDYEDFFLVSKDEVIIQLQNAETFVTAVKSYLDSKSISF